MYVLGIETSCDETAASVVKDGRIILSNEVSSSLRFHKRYGGVVPEIASRQQLETIAEVTDCAIKEAGVSLKDINLVGVTSGPGLLGSLLVGISFAKAISLSRRIPLIGINHLYSHIYANFLDGGDAPSLPFIALVVSGGHTSLFYVEDFDKIKIMGTTLDDACGEAFDKVAKILGLGYPGGPLIERLAKSGNPKIKFSCSNTEKPLDFSFSGIKTAVLYYVRQLTGEPVPNGLTHRCVTSGFQGQTNDIAASFQKAVINTLINKSLLACRMKNIKRLVVGGGVAANGKLREKFYQQIQEKGIKCYFPLRQLCMDNAAMVAGLGYRLFKKGYNLKGEKDAY